MPFKNRPTVTYTTSTKTTTTRTVTSSNKKALCTGINLYPDPRNNLMGCVNDANDIGSRLQNRYNFYVKILLNNQVTSINFKEIAGNWFTSSKADDKFVISYSGHGSNVKDLNGDEEDGRDECICLYDRFFIDDEIRDLFKLLHPEASLTFISDSCHSGTVTRAFINAMSSSDERLVPRFIPPTDELEASNGIRSLDVKSRIFYPEENMNHVLIAGCLPTEFSYDARVNGRNNGAMTAMICQILDAKPNITYNDFYVQLRKKLPSADWPQTPQLEGSDVNKSRLMFQ